MLKGTSIETAYYRFLERYLTPLLLQLHLKPNHVTILGLFVSMMAGISFAYCPLWGGLLTLLTGLLDTLDGSLARTLGHTKKYGAFLDSVLDRYTEFIIYLGIWCYFYRTGTAIPFISFLILVILFGSLMVSYTRARAEGLGVNCLRGLLQRGERIILIGLAGIFNPAVNHLLGDPSNRWFEDILLVSILLLLAIGTNLTALWRFINVLKDLRG
jgi:CDP-diacylglycerol---glycerol-3-phosphate 3-phosphatidyltransferase